MNCRAQVHRLSEISLAIAVSFQCSNRAYLIPEWHATLLYKRCQSRNLVLLAKSGIKGLRRRDLNGRETVVSLGENANYQIAAQDLYYSELWIAFPVKINRRCASYSRHSRGYRVNTTIQCEISDKVPKV